MSKLMIPAAVGVAVLGIVLGLVCTGAIFPDESPKVFYRDGGRVVESEFTLNRLRKAIGAKNGPVESKGKLTLTGTAMEITLSRTGDGDLMVDRMVSTAFRQARESGSEAAAYFLKGDPILKPEVILPNLGK